MRTASTATAARPRTISPAAVAVLAVLMHRRPAAVALLAVAALPFRLPISSGGTTSNLLIPLYLVVAAGALAFAVPRLRGEREAAGFDFDEPPPEADGAGVGAAAAAEPPPHALEWLLMAFVLLYAVQATYSSDFNKALQQLVFFYVPFALLFALLRRVRWTSGLIAACLGVVVVEAVVFAGIGFVEYSRRS